MKKPITIENAVDHYIQSNKIKNIVHIQGGSVQSIEGDVFVVDYDNMEDIDSDDFNSLEDLIKAMKESGGI